MIKTLIIDNNFHFVQWIINTISNQIPDVKVENIACTGKEALEIIESKNIDLILLDLQITKINGIAVLRKMQAINLLKVPKIIIISSDMKYIDEIKQNKDVYNIILKNENEDVIIRKIKQVVWAINYEMNYKNVKEKILQEISGMGYNIKHLGTKYLVEAITYIYESNNYDLTDNLEKNVYKYIAYKHKKTTKNIANNISKSALTRQVKCSPKCAVCSIIEKIR